MKYAGSALRITGAVLLFIVLAVPLFWAFDGTELVRGWLRAWGPSGPIRVADDAVPESDAVFAAMQAEMTRATEDLKLKDVEKPEFLSYTVIERRSRNVTAKFGALTDDKVDVDRSADVDLRVGNGDFDSGHFTGWDYWRSRGIEQVTLPLDDRPLALRTALWRATDAAYHGALERWAKKQETVSRHDRPPDRLDSPMIVRIRPGPGIGAPPPGDLDLAAAAKKASWVFRGRKGVTDGTAELIFERRRRRYLDSNGTALLTETAVLRLRLEVSARRRDRRALDFETVAFWPVRDRLPEPEKIQRVAEDLASDIEGLLSEKGPDAYVGPVLFTGEAATGFFAQALGDAVSFSREWDGPGASSFKPGALTGRAGMKVAAPLLSAVDDPTREAFEGTALAGYYGFDDEGVAAEPVSLLEKGRLAGLPLGRRPARREDKMSNGHGRAAQGENPDGRFSNLFVEGDGALPADAMRAKLLEVAKEAGLEKALVVTRLDNAENRTDGAVLSDPSVAWLVDASGRETAVTGLAFTEVSAALLKDVAAVSKERTVMNYYWGSHGRGDSPDRVSAAVVAPDVLVSEMSLKRAAQEPLAYNDVIESPLSSEGAAGTVYGLEQSPGKTYGGDVP